MGSEPIGICTHLPRSQMQHRRHEQRAGDRMTHRMAFFAVLGAFSGAPSIWLGSKARASASIGRIKDLCYHLAPTRSSSRPRAIRQMSGMRRRRSDGSENDHRRDRRSPCPSPGEIMKRRRGKRSPSRTGLEAELASKSRSPRRAVLPSKRRNLDQSR
jgi:hypothetical protein